MPLQRQALVLRVRSWEMSCAAYVGGSTLTGAGQAVGLVQFDGYSTADIAYYESLAGIPSVTVSNVLLDGFSGLPSGTGDEIEVCLDIEMVMSVAPIVSKIIVYGSQCSPFEASCRSDDDG